MADDSIEIIQPLDNHPCNSPRGLLYYDLNILTEEQQIKLNAWKLDIIRENEKYLAAHPQVRALVALISRRVFLCRPRSNLHEFVGNFMSRSKIDINEEIEAYLLEREPHVYEGNSAVVIHGESTEESTESEEDEDLKYIPREMLDEIINTAFKKLGLDVEDITKLVDVQKIPEHSTRSVVKGIIADIIDSAMTRGDLLRYLQSLEVPEGEFDKTISKSKSFTPSFRMDHTELEDNVLTYLEYESDVKDKEYPSNQETQDHILEQPQEEEEELWPEIE